MFSITVVSNAYNGPTQETAIVTIWNFENGTGAIKSLYDNNDVWYCAKNIRGTVPDTSECYCGFGWPDFKMIIGMKVSFERSMDSINRRCAKYVQMENGDKIDCYIRCADCERKQNIEEEIAE